MEPKLVNNSAPQSTRQSFMKRSASVNFDLNPVQGASRFARIADNQVSNKLKKWYDIKKLDNQTLNFEKVLEESKPSNMAKFKTIADIRKKTIEECPDDKSIVHSINKLR